jgi:riboflavin biosynthesis pyrimidine reductase
MRLLLSETGTPAPGTELDKEALRALYAGPSRPWLRVNFVSTLDGAATGDDGRSGSINTDADFVVFQLLRELADVVVVGAGTVRNEGYVPLRDEDPAAPPLAVVSHTARLPEKLRGSEPGAVLLVTRGGADPAALDDAREALGEQHVVLAGDERVDLVAARKALEDRGMMQIVSEGGPTLLGTMLSAGVVDELDLTWSPTLVGGDHTRVVAGPPVDLALEPVVLVEQDGSVMGRWRVSR